jgi:uncharacterized membrane protein YeaQ/YmgE (transglycosylase-associated protein family)
VKFLEFLVVGSIAGWVLGKIRRGKGYGLIGNLVIGCLGAVIGGFLSGFLGTTPTNPLGEVVMAVCGAIVFFLTLALLRPVFKRRKSSSKEEED